MDIFSRPIAFHPAYVPHFGVTGALMLSQALYWRERTRDPDGWFYKTGKEWSLETGLTRTEQETARKKLVKAGVFHEERRGVPARMFYRVDIQALIQFAGIPQTGLQESRELDCRNPANKSAGIPQSTNTETTSETTPKKKAKKITKKEQSRIMNLSIQLQDSWGKCYQKQFDTGYLFGKQDLEAIKGLVTAFEIEEILSTAMLAWQNEGKESFWSKNASTLPGLLKHWNNIRAELSKLKRKTDQKKIMTIAEALDAKRKERMMKKGSTAEKILDN